MKNLGAASADNPAEVARQVDIVFTNLPDSPDVELVVLGENGIIQGAHKGIIFIDNSTIKPASTRKIADELGNTRTANMIVLGAYIGYTSILPKSVVVDSLPKFIKHKALVPLNVQAIEKGIEFALNNK